MFRAHAGCLVVRWREKVRVRRLVLRIRSERKVVVGIVMIAVVIGALTFGRREEQVTLEARGGRA